MAYYKVFKNLDYSPHSCYPNVSKQPDHNLDAMSSAQIEEMKIINALADKEDRLQAFQFKAKQRVKMYSLLKSEHLQDQHQKERPINKTIVKENLKASNPRFGPISLNHQDQLKDDIQIEVNETFLQQMNDEPPSSPLHIDLSQLSSQRTDSQCTRIGNRSEVAPSQSSRSCSSTSSREIARALDIRQPPEVLFTPPEKTLRSTPNSRLQEVQERAVYRKAYGELERERVRKQRLQKEATQNAKKIKAKAELSRKQQENQLNKSLWQEELSAGLSDDNSVQEGWSKDCGLRSDRSTNDNSERIFRAILSELRERCSQMQLNPPPLCMCWEDVWSANPSHCANNCEFYKNHKGYLNTLQSLVDSICKR